MQFELYKTNIERVRRVTECSCLTPTQAVNAAISYGYRFSSALSSFGRLTDGSVYCRQEDGENVILDSGEAEEVLVWILDHLHRGTVGGFRGEMSEDGEGDLVIPFFNSWFDEEEENEERALRLEVERVERLVEEHEAKRKGKRK
jgi:hypothetical protein